MPTETLLFVDDDPRALRQIESIVNASRTRAMYASNGDQALRLLRAAPCAVMVTDLIMPGMNGYELSIAALREFPEMRIFLATELASPEVCRLAIDVGITRVFIKPWTGHRIRRMLRIVIEPPPALPLRAQNGHRAPAAESGDEGRQRLNHTVQSRGNKGK